MSLLEERIAYKPFKYPWAYEAWQAQQQVHWMPEEVPLADDVRDWNKKLTAEERSLVTQIFRFFTTSDVEVNNCYNRLYMQVFKPTEVVMMLTSFANMETIHVAAYSHLLDTLGMPETEYEAFLKYKEMKDKFDYMRTADVSTKEGIAETLAMFGAFTEGLQLFASFAILLNFPRHNKLKGMGQIIAWSVRDESLHCESIIKLFRTFIAENRSIWNDALKKKIYDCCRTIVEHEDAFIDLAFSAGMVEGITPDEIKQYIRYIADRRLLQLGLRPNYGVTKNPLPWMDEMLNGAEFGNFFEVRVTEYSRGATVGKWEDVYTKDHIRIFGIEGCQWCEKALELVQVHNQYWCYDEVDEEWKQALIAEHGQSTFPIVLVNDNLLGGYTELREYLTK